MPWSGVTSVAFIGQDASFEVQSARIQSALSSPFTIELVATSEDQDIDLDALVGSDVKVAVVAEGAMAGTMASAMAAALFGSAGLEWSGICNAAELLDVLDTGHASYALTIVPKLWLLTQRRNYRIFQRQNALDVVKAVLDQWGVLHAETDVNASALPKLDYRVQHGESDFAFVSRMLEEAGISYYFRKVDEGSQMFLTDRPQRAERSGEPLPFGTHPQTDVRHVWQVHRATSSRYGSIVLQDYDFRQPTLIQSGAAQADTADSPTQPSEALRELYDYVPGQSLVVSDSTEMPLADQQGAARAGASEFTQLATQRLEGLRVARKRVHFMTNAFDLAPGVVTAITGHARRDLGPDKNLLVTSVLLDGGGPDVGYRVSAQAVFADAPYHPPPVTPRPSALGLVTARVVGPAGQEIYTDEFGRVRVQFPWDRLGRNDEHSSCWIRVSQAWAGTGYGQITIPRVGQEVLVGFIGGDPDQPVIVGRMYNATQQVPYGLPDAKNFSGWKSNTTPGSDGFNELRFEDTKGQEQVFVQAQKDLTKYVKHDEQERTDHDRTIHVLHDLTQNVDNDHTETIGGNHQRRVTGYHEDVVKLDHTTRVKGATKVARGGALDDVVGADARYQVNGTRSLQVAGADKVAVAGSASLNVGGSLQVKTGGRSALDSGGEIHIKGGGVVVIEGGAAVSIKAGGSFIDIGPAGVAISGAVVNINSGGAPHSGSGASPSAPDAANVGGDHAPAPGGQPQQPGTGPKQEPEPGGVPQKSPGMEWGPDGPLIPSDRPKLPQPHQPQPPQHPGTVLQPQQPQQPGMEWGPEGPLIPSDRPKLPQQPGTGPQQPDDDPTQPVPGGDQRKPGSGGTL
jgi:type VI secretion system secreted protein VgrG